MFARKGALRKRSEEKCTIPLHRVASTAREEGHCGSGSGTSGKLDVLRNAVGARHPWRGEFARVFLWRTAL